MYLSIEAYHYYLAGVIILTSVSIVLIMLLVPYEKNDVTKKGDGPTDNFPR